MGGWGGCNEKEAQKNKQNMNAGFTMRHFTLSGETQVKWLQRKTPGGKSSNSNKDATENKNVKMLEVELVCTR